MVLTSGVEGQGADQDEDEESGEDTAAASVVIPQLPGEPDVAVGGEDGAGSLGAREVGPRAHRAHWYLEQWRHNDNNAFTEQESYYQ